MGWACGAALGVARLVWGRRCVGDRSVGGLGAQFIWVAREVNAFVTG